MDLWILILQTALVSLLGWKVWTNLNISEMNRTRLLNDVGIGRLLQVLGLLVVVHRGSDLVLNSPRPLQAAISVVLVCMGTLIQFLGWVLKHESLRRLLRDSRSDP